MVCCMFRPFGRSATKSSAGVTPALIYTCKLIYAETWPVQLARIRLHMVTLEDHQPQHSLLPPRIIRPWVREIWIHCMDWRSSTPELPPMKPFMFHQYPRLATFRIVRFSDGPQYHINVKSLSPKATARALRRYIERPPRWERSQFRQSNWIRQVLNPKTFREPVDLYLTRTAKARR